MDGVITAYSGTTLTVLVDDTAGTGTYTDWSINPWGTVAGIMHTLAGDAGVASFDDAALSALDAAQPATVSYWVPDGSNGLSLLDAIADGSGCYWGFDRSGSFEAGRVTAPGTATASYDETQVHELQRLATDEPHFQFTVRYRRNWSPLTVEQIAGVADADKTWLSTQWRDTVATDDATLTAYPLSQTVTIESIFDEEADATAEASRQLSLFGTRRDYFKVKLKVQPLAVENGDTVSVTHARYGLSGGKALRVVDLTEDMDAYEVDLGLWG